MTFGWPCLVKCGHTPHPTSKYLRLRADGVYADVIDRHSMARNAQTQQSIFGLHLAYAQVTATFVHVDCSEMNSIDSKHGWQEPVSPSFLLHLYWLMCDYSRPTVHGASIMDPDVLWPDAVFRLLQEFRDTRIPPEPPLTSFIHLLGIGIAGLLAAHPRFVDCLGPIVHLVSLSVRNEVTRLQSTPYLQSPERETASLVVSQGYTFFKAISDALHACIDKHVNQIPAHTAEHLITGLSHILRLTLRSGCEDTVALIQTHHQEYPAVRHEDPIKILVGEWRMEVHRKLLMSSQMQLRIIAAPAMCQELVEIWTENHDFAQTPVLRHFSNKLMQSGVIDYILGPTCHPEVTTQSYNIIGFLFASHTVTQEHIDLMWRTATTCQISGVSDSLLAMVGQITNLFSVPDLLSVCCKLETVAIENFTPTMKEFCDKVITHLHHKANTITDLLPYSLMFRLLRESSVPGPPLYQDIQKLASDQIPQLLRRGPMPQDRQLLQQECLKDIAEKTRYTLGSIHALVLLCRPVSRDRDMQQLILQYDLPRLLVDELEHAIMSRKDTGLQHAISGPENAPRLQLLGTVVLSAESNALSDDLGRKLWELLVGKGAASEQDRDCAWLSFNAVMGDDSGHPFLETCFQEYFPTLPPDLFRSGTLEFVLQRVGPLLNQPDSFVLEDTESTGHAAIEQLWRVALMAPTGTIEQQAIKTLVKDVYLMNTAMQHMPLHRARNIHLALVSRCMKQLSSAAKQCAAGAETLEDKKSDHDMIVEEYQNPEQEQLFERSLTIVTEFHKLYQKMPRFSTPDLRSLGLADSKDMAGESAELKVQSFDGPTQTDVKPLPIGRLNTAGSLLASIRSVTGFDNYRLYYKGQPFTPSEADICKSLEDLHIIDGLILVKRETDTAEPPAHVRPGASPVEIEIMRHFDELWGFLALKESLAGRIYDFLVALPVDEHILNLLAKETTTYEDVFPVGQPLKSLYALYAIQKYLASLSPMNAPSDSGIYGDALQRILKLVIAAISDPEVIDSGSGVILKAKLAARLVQQYGAILTDPLCASSTAELLSQNLMSRLNELLVSALELEASPPITDLVIESFSAILETCTLKTDLWDLLNSQTRFREFVQKLLIDDDREIVRIATASHIGSKILSGSPAVSAAALRAVFWPLLMELFPHALRMPSHSLECFNLSARILLAAKGSQPPELDLKAAVRHIYLLLVDSYRVSESPALALSPMRSPNETSGQNTCYPGTDRGAYGLVLLLEILLCGKANQDLLESLPSGSGLRLFTRLLFPEMKDWQGPNLLWAQGLVFTEPTRRRLHNIVLALAGRDLEQLRDIFHAFQVLTPCADNSKPEYPIYAYDLPFEFDRAKETRAACGYAGLRNLSNTCYLNSLCTQLFMNMNFRQFMLSISVDSKDRSRALLSETQQMFAQLQSGQHRFVDPEMFVASIKTYDDDLINVNHQMDVEEFFNLLNDRWEGQLRTPETVRRFRAFYGGQLVTQTKSKECDHISEVMEPFSAIQCDIKGKKNLLESLEAYVNGEHMEGDNKYKCSSCDRHVDAVRRTCLKEIPDSLIFHLKRFDFNLRTQSRSKINDYFAFPTRIDMRPYTVEHLSNSPGDPADDFFVLVGVLVHAGTAESGHYYSYIRERPSSRPGGSWFEFNDDNVSPWNPLNMEMCCFGGPDSTWDATGVRYEKNHSAYMLFYERASSLARQQLDLQTLNVPSPIQVPVPEAIARSIRNRNVSLLRRHCLFDPDHLRFFNSAIERLLELNNGNCSDADHGMERLAIQTAIAHMDQVACRTNNATGARSLASCIVKMAEDCHDCACAVYTYLATHHEAFRNMVMRCPDAEARRCAADILIACIVPIKDGDIDIYSSTTFDALTGDLLGDDYPNDVINGVCEIFEYLWAILPAISMHRSWPEVFNMMARFVEEGSLETMTFLNHSLLYKTLMVFVAPWAAERAGDTQFVKFANFVNRRPNRQPQYAAVIELLKNILTQVTVKQPVHGYLEREKMLYIDGGEPPIRLTEDEIRLLYTPLDTPGNALVDKLLCINQNVEATDAIIAHILENKWSMDKHIFDTLRASLVPQQTYMSYGPYLRAAEQYCHSSHYATRINELIEQVVENCQAIAVNEGKAVWSFFNVAMDGGRLNSGQSRTTIAKQTLQCLPTWAPVLLQGFDAGIGTEVEAMLDEKVFALGTDPHFDEDEGGEEMSKMTVECAKAIGLQCCGYARNAFIRCNSSVPNSTVAAVHRVLSKASKYFDGEDAEGQMYLQNVEGKMHLLAVAIVNET